MTRVLDLYCAAAQSKPDGGVLSLGLVTLKGEWYYAEVIDYNLDECDDYARKNIIPRLMKIPHASFIRNALLPADVGEFVARTAGLSSCSEVVIHMLPVGYEQEAAKAAFRQVPGVKQGRLKIEVKPVGGLDLARFQDFHEHCGKGERTKEHSLINALGAMLCDTHRSKASSLAEVPIRHLELLMGSKNAMSYRAWVRSEEAAWRAAHAADQSA